MRDYDFKEKKPETFDQIVEFGYQVSKYYLGSIVKCKIVELNDRMEQVSKVKDLLPGKKNLPVPQHLIDLMDQKFKDLNFLKHPQNMTYRAIQVKDKKLALECIDYCLREDPMNSFAWYMLGFVADMEKKYWRAATYFFFSSLLDPFSLHGSAEHDCITCLMRAGCFKEVLALANYWRFYDEPYKFSEWDDVKRQTDFAKFMLGWQGEK